MKVSVALCTYNGSRFMREQVESILKQSYTVSQIVLCDDNSNDETVKIVSDLINHCGKGISLILKKNLVTYGARRNFESALSISDGDFIFLCDQDDIWHEKKVEYSIHYLSNNPNLLAVFTNATLINEIGKSLNYTSFQVLGFNPKYITTENYLFEEILVYRNIVTGATVCLKKEAKKLLLPFPSVFLKSYWHDEWIALRLSSIGKLGFIEIPLISYRIHDKQQVGFKSLNWTKNENSTLKTDLQVPVKPTSSLSGRLESLQCADQLLTRLKIFESSGIRVSPQIQRTYSLIKMEKARYLKTRGFFKKRILLLYWLFLNKFQVRFSDFLI